MACEAICLWVGAMYKYHFVAKVPRGPSWQLKVSTRMSVVQELSGVVTGPKGSILSRPKSSVWVQHLQICRTHN